MYKCIIKGCDCSNLLKAIDSYIAKVDDSLSKELARAGYVDTDASVSDASDLEDDLADTLTEQTSRLVEVLEGVTTLEAAEKILEDFFKNDTSKEDMKQLFMDFYENHVLDHANAYIRESSGDMVVTQLRKRTTDWIDEWSDELSDLMHLNAEADIGRKLKSAVDNGKSVSDFAQELICDGIRNEQYTARRAALTEMLRCHSVAHNEAMIQDPSVAKKKWRHTGSRKNQPRANHVAMNGQMVDKDKPFKLIGADGVTYYPMFPMDPILPAEEVINCHCLSQPIVDDDILGMSLEERQKLQQEIIDNDNDEWMKALDAENKAKAGIKEPGTEKYKDVTQKLLDRGKNRKGSVVEAKSYTVDGVTYKVDGKHVLLDHTEKEKHIAEVIKDKIGGNVQLIPRVLEPAGISTADYLIDGEKYDLKEPTGESKNVLYNMVNKKKKQAPNFVFDISNCPLEESDLIRQAEGLFESYHTRFIENVMVIKDDEILKIIKKRN